MKLVMSFVSALLLMFITTTVSAATTTVTTVTTNTTKVSKTATAHCKIYHKKHKKHYRKHYSTTRTYYMAGYCVADASACGGQVCYSGHYYRCKTEYYYHAGRNSARVEMCY